MPSISKKSIYLTLCYFCIWCAGPLFFSEMGSYLGLPAWFWISCLLAPLSLITYLIFSLAGTSND